MEVDGFVRLAKADFFNESTFYKFSLNLRSMWLLILLLCLIAVLLAPLVWAMIQVSKLKFADARGQVVDPSQVPEEVMLKLKDQVEPLVETGFEYLGMRRETRGEGDYWQVFLSSAGGMVWAVAEESGDAARGRRVSLLSFGDNGSVAITRDGDGVFGEDDPSLITKQDSFTSALDHAEKHAALLAEKQVPVVALEPGVFLGRYERMGTQGLDALFQRGWLYETAGHSLQISPTKLPQVALAWLKHRLDAWLRVRNGSSWLLAQNLGEKEEEPIFEESLPENEPSLGDEDSMAEEVATASLAVDEVTLGDAADAADATVNEEVEVPILQSEEQALAELRADAMPVGPVEDVLVEPVEDPIADELALEASVDPLSELMDEEIAEPIEDTLFGDEQDLVVEELQKEEPVVAIPEEDGLARDWALYQQKTSEKTWSYWLSGFGWRALLFVGLLAFAIWMAISGGWGLRIVFFGVVALFVHEAGHAVVMLARRTWDWSQFLIPIPRPMSAKQWSVKGGWGELLTILAGPVPGLAGGWLILAAAYSGVSMSDFVLDLALAFVVVNSLTLLPFLPFDGGRLLDLVFLRQVPQLRTLGLVLTGCLFFGLAFFGGGLLAVVGALLMWAGIPAARRKSKLLPWLRANATEEDEQQVIAAYQISRENSVQKGFQGARGMARLDELIGLGQAKALGLLGGAIALGFIAFAWFAPLALPSYGLAANSQDWWQAQATAKTQAEGYLGALRPLAAAQSVSPEEESEALADAKFDLSNWQKRLAKNPSQPEKVFSDINDLNAARTMRWRIAAHWIAGATSANQHDARQHVAREAIRALRREAIRSADKGDGIQAFRDLSVALRVVIECEPRNSLAEWVSWIELEREVLKDVEDVSSRYELNDNYGKWYETALAQCPRPTSKKVAGLILAEQPSLKDLLRQLDFEAAVSPKAEASPGRRFLGIFRGVGGLVSADSLRERQELARVFAEASSLAVGAQALKEQGNLPLEVEESLQRIESNYSFRQIAMTGLKVKRLGMQGAARERAQLRDQFGYTSRLDQTDERMALKLSRLNPAGEVIEMEWLLRQ